MNVSFQMASLYLYNILHTLCNGNNKKVEKKCHYVIYSSVHFISKSTYPNI